MYIGNTSHYTNSTSIYIFNTIYLHTYIHYIHYTTYVYTYYIYIFIPVIHTHTLYILRIFIPIISHTSYVYIYTNLIRTLLNTITYIKYVHNIYILYAQNTSISTHILYMVYINTLIHT